VTWNSGKYPVDSEIIPKTSSQVKYSSNVPKSSKNKNEDEHNIEIVYMSHLRMFHMSYD
jgi:hypothetical protein